MSGIDIFVAILSAVMLFGGLYLNFVSRKLSDEYAEAHRVVVQASKPIQPKASKVQKKNA